MATISFNVGKTISISHNNRDNIHGNEDIKTDKIEDNIYYIQKDIREIYHEEFDDVVEKYNTKQKRADRKIEDYYSKVLHDKKTEHHREIIVAIGEQKENIRGDVWESKKNILDDYAKTFQNRNPNLKVYNMVQHLDEANPHLHITYVPVADYSRGLEKRVANNKALEQQGYDSFADWRTAETKFLEEKMNDYDLERDFKGSHAYFSVNEYKYLKEELNTLETSKNELKMELSEVKDVKIDEIKVEPQLLSKEKLTISKADFELVKDIHEKSMKILAKEESLDTQKSSLEKRSKALDEREVELDNRIKSLDRREENIEQEKTRVDKELKHKKIKFEESFACREENLYFKEIQTNNLYNLQKNLNEKYEEKSHELGALGLENERLSDRISDLERENTILRKYVNELIKIVVVAYQVSRDSKEVVKETFNRMIDSISPKLWFEVTDESGKDFCKSELNQTEKKIEEEKQKEKERERQKSYEADHGIDF